MTLQSNNNGYRGGFFRFFIANTAMLRYNIYDKFIDEFVLY